MKKNKREQEDVAVMYIDRSIDSLLVSVCSILSYTNEKHESSKVGTIILPHPKTQKQPNPNNQNTQKHRVYRIMKWAFFRNEQGLRCVCRLKVGESL